MPCAAAHVPCCSSRPGAVCVLYPLLAPTAHRIDAEHCDRIKAGMTRAEVEAILGVPAGRYDWAEPDRAVHRHLFKAVRMAHRIQTEQMTVQFRSGVNGLREASWVSRHGAFAVSFDDDDRVVSSSRRGGVRIVPPWQRWWQRAGGPQ
jgi:hypothetical protein